QLIVTTHSLKHFTLTQLRYDLRKLKAHGLLERQDQRYLYQLTDKGLKVALMFVLFHKRVCGPLAYSLFNRKPDPTLPVNSKLETAYRRGDYFIQKNRRPFGGMNMLEINSQTVPSKNLNHRLLVKPIDKAGLADFGEDGIVDEGFRLRGLRSGMS